MTIVDAICLSLCICGVMVATFFAVLKIWDAIRAWRYNVKVARLRDRLESFTDGYSAAMGDYAKVQTVRVVRATPDRPRSQPCSDKVGQNWAGKTVEEIIEELEGSP